MLYKFFSKDHCADGPRRIGVMQAGSLSEAVEELKRWNQEHVDWGDYKPQGDPSVRMGEDQATITYTSTLTLDDEDTDVETGQDVYIIRPVGDKVLSFLAEDWNLVFS